MIRYIRDLRLIPIALIASLCLLTLKTADLVVHSSHFFDGDGNYAGDGRDGDMAVIHPSPDGMLPSGKPPSWAHQMFNFPDGSAVPPAPSALPHGPTRVADSADITGSVATEPASEKKAADSKKPGPASPDAKSAPDGKPALVPLGKDGQPVAAPNGNLIPNEVTALPSGAERAILERLQERRQELDTRARELDIRESLIQNAEKRMQSRLDELKATEERIKVETQQKNDADAERMKGLVTMYQNMKARDAAKIFNGLDSGVLLEVASAINPRQMAEIMGQMAPEVAQHLTVELASKAQDAKADGPGDLPKIEGQPTTP